MIREACISTNKDSTLLLTNALNWSVKSYKNSLNKDVLINLQEFFKETQQSQCMLIILDSVCQRQMILLILITTHHFKSSQFPPLYLFYALCVSCFICFLQQNMSYTYIDSGMFQCNQ